MAQTLLGQMELLDLARGKYKYVNVNTRQTNQKKNLKIQDDIKIFFPICDLKLQKKIFFSSIECLFY